MLTRRDWLDLRLPLGIGLDNPVVSWDEQPSEPTLTEVCANAAVQRIAEVLATTTQIVNTTRYRLIDLSASATRISRQLALTDFNSYALTMDMLENELIDALAD